MDIPGSPMDVDHGRVPLFPPGLEQQSSDIDVELSDATEETEDIVVDQSPSDYISMDISSAPHTPHFIYSSAAPDFPMADSWGQEVLDALDVVFGRPDLQMADSWGQEVIDALDVVLGRLSVSPSEPSSGPAVASVPAVVEKRDEYDEYLDGPSEDVDVPAAVPDVVASPTTPVRKAAPPVLVGLGISLPGENGSAASPTLEVNNRGLFSPDSDEAVDAAVVEQLIDEGLFEAPGQVNENPTVPIFSFGDNIPLGDNTGSGASVSEGSTLASGNHLADSVMLGDSLASDDNTLVDVTDDMDLKTSSVPPAAPRKPKSALRRYTEEDHSSKAKAKFKRAERQVRFDPYSSEKRKKKNNEDEDEDLSKLLFQPGPSTPKKDKGKAAVKVKQEPVMPTLPPSPLIKEEPVSPTISFCDNVAIDVLAASLESTTVSEDATFVNDVADAEGAEDKDASPPSPLARKGKGRGKGKGKDKASTPNALKATQPFKAKRAERRARSAPY